MQHDTHDDSVSISITEEPRPTMYAEYLHGRQLRTMTSRVMSPPLELVTTDDAFQPNPTTVRFARCIQINPGDVVFDIGTGIGPLALMAAHAGARQVIGIDPVALHCELATLNALHYGLQDTVQFHHGHFFDPLHDNHGSGSCKANVIIGDVSGIADTVAHALGWYSPLVPAGGDDGTEVICTFLKQVPDHLADGGRVYFPIACDLSDGKQILQLAERLFQNVENALPKPYVEFPLGAEQVQAIDDAYAGHVPSFIQIKKGKRPSCAARYSLPLSLGPAQQGAEVFSDVTPSTMIADLDHSPVLIFHEVTRACGPDPPARPSICPAASAP